MVQKSFIFLLGIFLILIPTLYTIFFPGKIVLITVVCFIPLLLINFYIFFQFGFKEIDGKNVLLFFGITNVYILVSSFFNINSNTDFTNIPGLFFKTLAIPLFIFWAQFKYLPYLFRYLLLLALPLSFITYFYEPSDPFMSFQHNISFIFVFVFMIPFIEKKWILFILLVVSLGIFYNVTRRSFVLNAMTCFVIVLMVLFFKVHIIKKLLNFLFIPLILLPIIFLVLGVSGVFNIFKIGENSSLFIQYGKFERDVVVDSRTSVYEDVFLELNRQDKWLLGLGGNGKTKTKLVEVEWAAFNKIYSKGRLSTESGMLNYIQWGGLIAGFSFWLVIIFSSYLAIFDSNNSLIFSLGLFMLFKVTYVFIEDAVSTNMTTFSFFIFIGFCLSKPFRYLNNLQIKSLTQIIFNVKFLFK
ncbi:MAG: hypothetical protein ACK4LB_14745 [Spirosomataceae bacterium]